MTSGFGVQHVGSSPGALPPAATFHVTANWLPIRPGSPEPGLPLPRIQGKLHVCRRNLTMRAVYFPNFSMSCLNMRFIKNIYDDMGNVFVIK